jgi:hypothetical protein
MDLAKYCSAPAKQLVGELRAHQIPFLEIMLLLTPLMDFYGPSKVLVWEKVRRLCGRRRRPDVAILSTFCSVSKSPTGKLSNSVFLCTNFSLNKKTINI